MSYSNDVRKILVVDDETEIREILISIIADLGIQIYEAENGEQALELMTQQHFDAVVSDISMPKMSGLDCLATGLAQGIDSPFVIITGYGDSKNILQAVRLGAFDFIQKPFDNQEVLDVVSRATDIGARRKRIMNELQSERPDVYRKVRHEQKMISLLLANNNLKRRTQ